VTLILVAVTGDPRHHVTTEEEAIKYQKVSNYLQCVKNTDEVSMHAYVRGCISYFPGRRIPYRAAPLRLLLWNPVCVQIVDTNFRCFEKERVVELKVSMPTLLNCLLSLSRRLVECIE
jgi:hypothetical protein